MGRRFGRLGVFRPVVAAGTPDPVLALLRSRGAADAPEAASVGVFYDDVHADQEGAIAEIVVRYRALARDCDAVLVVGTDFTDVGASGSLRSTPASRRTSAFRRYASCQVPADRRTR